MFEPARLCTGSRPAARSAAASMPAVVVLPLVALTIVDPRVSSAPRREIASGAMRSSSRPGRVVPPPRPLRRLSAPVARAIPTLARKAAALIPAAPGGHDHPQGAGQQAHDRAGRSAMWSPSA